MEATELRFELYQLAAAVEDDFPPWALGSRPNRFTFSSPVAKAQPRGAAQ